MRTSTPPRQGWRPGPFSGRAPPQRLALPLTQAFLEMSLDVNIGREVTSPGAFVLTLRAALPGPHSLPAEPWLASCPSQSREAAAAPQRGQVGLAGWRAASPSSSGALLQSRGR